MLSVKTSGVVTLALVMPILVSGCSESSTQDVQTINLRVGASHPTSVPWVGGIPESFIPEVNRRVAELETPYQIIWQEAYGGQLYKANATLSSVSEGIVDLGWVFSTLEASRQPLAQVAAYAPATTSDPAIMMDVFNELNRTVPALTAEWENNNLVFLGASAGDTYQLFTTSPVEELSDLHGQRISAAGVISSWLRGTGAVGVQGAVPDFYTQVQTGITNGVLLLPSAGFSIKLPEVAPYLTKVNLGSLYFGGLAANKDSFERLPEEVQDIFLEAGELYSRSIAEGVMAIYEQGMENMESDLNVTVRSWSDEQTLAWVNSMPNLAKEWVEDNEAKGLPAVEVLRAYMNAMRERGVEPLRDWDEEVN